MSTTSDDTRPQPPAIRFGLGEDTPTALATSVEFVPREALVFWEEERSDSYARVVGLVVGATLKLVKVTVGRENSLQVLCAAPLATGVASNVPHFVTRDAFLFFTEPRPPRRIAKTIVLRIGDAMKMVRVTAEEHASEIEVLATVDVGA